MKYLLMPFTLLIWFLTAYYGVYLSMLGVAFLFSLSWVWITVGYLFLIGAMSAIAVTIPGLLRYQILKLYGVNWFSCIVHSLAGLAGFTIMVLFFMANPPELVAGEESHFFLSVMWAFAPIKTISAVFPFVGLIMSLFWSTVIAPIYIKISGEESILA